MPDAGRNRGHRRYRVDNEQVEVKIGKRVGSRGGNCRLKVGSERISQNSTLIGCD